jgi:hypothetical protein
LHPPRKRADISDRLGAGGSGAICEVAAAVGRSSGGDHRQHHSRTVLGSKGLLRPGTNRRALASSAPFCIRVVHDGRLRRESKTT